MFQSDGEITFDEDFLSDAFELNATTTSGVESAKRPVDENGGEPVKKLCTSTRNILSIINANGREARNFGPKRGQRSPESVFSRPAVPDKPRRVVQRKFPGPAGILPAQRQLNVDLQKLERLDVSVGDKSLEPDEIVCSQYSEAVFARQPWLEMLHDLSGGGSMPPLTDTYTIAWIKAKAASRQLVGRKTPLLAAVIEHVDCSSKDPMAVLKDTTGEIQATLIQEVWQEYAHVLLPGSVILLRQVGVLTTAKRHYLAVTLNNIVTIYSEPDADTPTEAVVTRVQPMTSGELLASIAHGHTGHKIANPVCKPVNNAFFRANLADVSCNHTFDSSNLEQTVNTHSTNPFFNANLQNTSSTSPNYTKMDLISTNSNENNSFDSLQCHLAAKRRNAVQQDGRRAVKRQNKFVFEPKLDGNTGDLSLDGDNLSFLTIDLDNNTKVNADSEILSQVLDGVDVDSIFGDF